MLAVTFTNKAANEMRGRIQDLLEVPSGGMWVGTFHGLAHRIIAFALATSRFAANLPILDSENRLRLIKRVLKALELDDTQYPPRSIAGFINARKDDSRPQHIEDRGDYARRMIRDL